MMRRKRNDWIACLALGVLVTTVGQFPARAEVSADPSPAGVKMLILGIIEGPDPIPQVIWEPVRDVDPTWLLNSEGAERGDGRPDFAMDPVTGWPHVVWAWNQGTHHDIAYTQWNGNGWDAPEFLTVGTTSELDPRIFIDANTVYVVWWVEGSKKVWLKTRPRNGDWAMSELVSPSLHTGMRPSVVSWGGNVLIASEEDDGQGGKLILIATREAQGVYETEIVKSVAQGGSLDVILHHEQGRLWMDWRHSPVEFAYSEFGDDAWGNTQTVPWDEDSWSKLEEVRLLIRSLVFAP